MIHLAVRSSARAREQDLDLLRFFGERCPVRNAPWRGVALASFTVVGTPSDNPFLPSAADAARAPNPFEVRTTVPQPSPFGAAPSAEPIPGAGVDVVVDDMRMLDSDATYEDAAPSRQDLLQRAAELGPSRMTWESIVLQPTDPILGAKMQPRVAERRARFRKMVKVALGACLALCLVGTIASLVSSTSSDEAPAASLAKTAPAAGIVPVEKLELAVRGKATKTHATAAVRPRAKHAKHGKRR